MADDRTDPQYKLRLPAELKERIEDAAKASKRSMNAEIVARLEGSFSTLQPDTSVAAAAREAAMAATTVSLQGFHDARSLRHIDQTKADASHLEASALLFEAMKDPDPYQALMKLRDRIVHDGALYVAKPKEG